MDGDDKRDHPPVGAVILNQRGEIIGAGAHDIVDGKWNPNKPCVHAETLAFRDMYSKGRQSEAFALISTLEPCSARFRQHISCARTTAYLGIQEVHMGALDSSYQTRGTGAHFLQLRKAYFAMFPPDKKREIFKNNVFGNWTSRIEQDFEEGKMPPETMEKMRKSMMLLSWTCLPVEVLKAMDLAVGSFLRNAFKRFRKENSKNEVYESQKAELWSYYLASGDSREALVQKLKFAKVPNAEPWLVDLYSTIASFLGLPNSIKQENDVIHLLAQWSLNGFKTR